MQVAGVAGYRIAMLERRMYEAWQASRQCIEVEPPELLTTPVKQFEFERDCQWKCAISKAGIKVKGAWWPLYLCVANTLNNDR